jgi:hypothetical protein
MEEFRVPCLPRNRTVYELLRAYTTLAYRACRELSLSCRELCPTVINSGRHFTVLTGRSAPHCAIELVLLSFDD